MSRQGAAGSRRAPAGRATRRRRLARAVAVAACGALVAATPALAGIFQQIFQDYRKDQRISPCAWTPDQLRQAKGQTPPDIEQYAPSFVDELNAALEAHARGDCRKKAVAPPPVAPPPPPATPGTVLVDPGPTPVPPPSPTDQASIPVPPPPLDGGGAGPPWALIALAAMSGLALLAGGGYGLGRQLGWSLDGRAAGLRRGLRGALEWVTDLLVGTWDRVRLGR